MTKTQVYAVLVVLCAVATLATSGIGHAQVIAGQVVNKSGAPEYRVDPFWPNGKRIQKFAPVLTAARDGPITSVTRLAEPFRPVLHFEDQR